MKRRTRKGRGQPSRPGVADALFAKVQQRVLGVLFGNPGRSFYANEVIGLARSGTGAVQRELARLEAAASDVDLMVISERLTYADLFGTLGDASAHLGRKVAPTIYSPRELARRRKQDSAFVTRVLEQPKLWLIGDEGDFAA
jgi:hypothetical protein